MTTDLTNIMRPENKNYLGCSPFDAAGTFVELHQLKVLETKTELFLIRPPSPPPPLHYPLVMFSEFSPCRWQIPCLPWAGDDISNSSLQSLNDHLSLLPGDRLSALLSQHGCGVWQVISITEDLPASLSTFHFNFLNFEEKINILLNSLAEEKIGMSKLSPF